MYKVCNFIFFLFGIFATFEHIVNEYIEKYGTPDCIISGGAKGVDSMAEKHAKNHSIKMIVYRSDWGKYGKTAGLIRNTDIIKDATHVLALPTDKSIGTYDSIQKGNQDE
jgi:hypothetical protein